MELKESYYRYSAMTIKYLSVVNWLLVQAFLVSLVQLSYKYNLIDSLPPALSSRISEHASHILPQLRALPQVNQAIDLLVRN